MNKEYKAEVIRFTEDTLNYFTDNPRISTEELVKKLNSIDPNYLEKMAEMMEYACKLAFTGYGKEELLESWLEFFTKRNK